MASPGRYKAIQSSNPLLEVKKAGKRHTCAGIAIERGKRPGTLKDVWMLGRSKRCQGTIKTQDYYVANGILPNHILAVAWGYDHCWPTCLACAIETYPEFFTGPLTAQHLRPLTPERRTKVLQGLTTILDEAREMAVSENENGKQVA